ncbi:hypothetical protein CPB84DRAFT_1842207 [Gymnopilus junonius]|uniref:Uncharacterized protein n=1 Tax=Gymnopilus junonius TaxID=109634 RepID=A0A9P5P095_GYMJU|nr:hypothetical protein CPB84DRAFT_1842207 [Gymnopilus junonius]
MAPKSFLALLNSPSSDDAAFLLEEADMLLQDVSSFHQEGSWDVYPRSTTAQAAPVMTISQVPDEELLLYNVLDSFSSNNNLLAPSFTEHLWDQYTPPSSASTPSGYPSDVASQQVSPYTPPSTSRSAMHMTPMTQAPHPDWSPNTYTNSNHFLMNNSLLYIDMNLFPATNSPTHPVFNKYPNAAPYNNMLVAPWTYEPPNPVPQVISPDIPIFPENLDEDFQPQLDYPEQLLIANQTNGISIGHHIPSISISISMPDPEAYSGGFSGSIPSHTPENIYYEDGTEDCQMPSTSMHGPSSPSFDNHQYSPIPLGIDHSSSHTKPSQISPTVIILHTNDMLCLSIGGDKHCQQINSDATLGHQSSKTHFIEAKERLQKRGWKPTEKKGKVSSQDKPQQKKKRPRGKREEIWGPPGLGQTERIYTPEEQRAGACGILVLVDPQPAKKLRRLQVESAQLSKDLTLPIPVLVPASHPAEELPESHFLKDPNPQCEMPSAANGGPSWAAPALSSSNPAPTEHNMRECPGRLPSSCPSSHETSMASSPAQPQTPLTIPRTSWKRNYKDDEISTDAPCKPAAYLSDDGFQSGKLAGAGGSYKLDHGYFSIHVTASPKEAQEITVKQECSGRSTGPAHHCFFLVQNESKTMRWMNRDKATPPG